jgi:SSS family solute:Na+ symporter
MQSIQLAFSDWLIIALYFGFVLGIGFYLKRFTKNENDFFLAGRKNSAWVAGLAFLSANLGALELLGMTGNTFKYGMYVAHFYWIGAIPAMIFLGLYMMPFYYSSKIKSVPGYLKLRFDEKTRVLNGIAFAVMTLLVSGINLYAMALVLHTFLGWDWNVSMWISAVTVAAYVTLSGLLSAIFTEIIQFFLIWFGLFLVSILGVIEIGSVNDIFHRVNELYQSVSYTTLWSTSSNPSLNGMVVTWGGIVLGLGFVLSFGYWTTDFLVVQRAFSAKDLRTARMTPILASFFKMAVPFIVILTGLIAIVLANDAKSGFALTQDGGQVNYDSALPLLIARYYPPGLVGLGVTALLAGFMAGQAGNISAFNTVWTYDIYKSVLNKNAFRCPPSLDGPRGDHRGDPHQPCDCLLGEEFSEHHGLYAGDLFLGERTAVRNDASRHVCPLDHAERRVLGSVGRHGLFLHSLSCREVQLDRRKAPHNVESDERHGSELLACVVGMAHLLCRDDRSELLHKKETG